VNLAFSSCCVPCTYNIKWETLCREYRCCLLQLKKNNTLPESLAKGELGTADEKLTSREIINHSPKCLLVIKLLNYQLNKRKKKEVFSPSLHCYTNTSLSSYVHTLIHANVLRHSLGMHSPAPFQTSQVSEVQFPSQFPSGYEDQCKMED